MESIKIEVPYSFANRASRFCWYLIQGSLFRFSPTVFHGWRRFLLRSFGAIIGSSSRIYPRVRIWAPWNLECGSTVGIGNDAIIYNQGMIKIGDKVTISQGAHICSGTHDYKLPSFPLKVLPIVIGKHVWIAAEAFIHPGVIIGEGAVIGARSVVTKNMPSWMVCAGNPCRPIKERIVQIPKA